jgi:glycosyltransferase involved in cell wall biosynthesis
MSTDTVTLSIVIPAYNEADNLPELYRRLRDVLADLDETHEIVFVNDGSTDRSLEVMKQLRAQDGNVKIISFARNMGHQIALTGGLDHASGQAVITMDADLQHPPEAIPHLVEKWREGYEIVYTIRERSEGSGFIKNMTSSLFYSLLRLISQVDVKPRAADFRLMGRKSLAAFGSMRERRRYIRGLVGWLGFRSAEVTYVAQQRFAGNSKYCWHKMTHLALSGILSFSAVPLRASLYLGLVIASCSGLYALFAIYTRLFTDRLRSGWASLIVVTLFLGSMQLIFLGILGEYVATIVEEVKQRPLYIVDEMIGFDEAQ